MAHNDNLNIPHGPLSDYVKGLIWSVLLTIVSFGVVMTGAFDKSTSIVILFIMAIMQLLAQSIYFLHIKNTPDQTWTIISYIYTLLQAIIVIFGSIWIMWHLHFNMHIGN